MTLPVEQRRHEGWLVALLLALPLLAFLLRLGAAPLFDVDEGAFSEATREMFERGDFLSTYLKTANTASTNRSSSLAAGPLLSGAGAHRMGVPPSLGAGCDRLVLRDLAVRASALRPGHRAARLWESPRRRSARSPSDAPPPPMRCSICCWR